jgi:hypothetical protein
MDDTLIVEVKNEVCHISSKSGRFDQTCPAEYNAMLKQLAPHGVLREEFDEVLFQVQRTGRAEIEVSLSVSKSQL